MNRRLFLSLLSSISFLLAISFLLLISFLLAISGPVSAGTRVGNSGSALQCDGMPLEIADGKKFSVRSDALLVAEREEFIRRILAKIDDPTAQSLLRTQWDRYGDSDLWPEGDLNSIEAYYYDVEGPIRYRQDGTIPASIGFCDPLVSLCCDRVLVSYFTEDSPTPFKLSSTHSRLSRVQKNILELHEAAYRAARDLGALPPPYPSTLSSQWMAAEFIHYRGRLTLRSPPELPDEIVRDWLGRLLAHYPESAEHAAVFLRKLWIWSHGIYGDGAVRRDFDELSLRR